MCTYVQCCSKYVHIHVGACTMLCQVHVCVILHVYVHVHQLNLSFLLSHSSVTHLLLHVLVLIQLFCGRDKVSVVIETLTVCACISVCSEFSLWWGFPPP